MTSLPSWNYARGARSHGRARSPHIAARGLALACAGLLVGACGDDITNASDTQGDSTSAGTSAGTDSSAGTTAGTTAGTSATGGSETGASTSPTTDSTSSPSSTGAPTTGGVTTAMTSVGETDPTTGGETSGTTGDGICEFVGTDSIAAKLFDADAPDMACGKVEFTGRLDAMGGGVWNLDACPCGAQCLVPDPWTLELQAPPDWMPSVPACPRIILHTASTFDPEVCIVNGLAIWDLDTPGAPPVYYAGGVGGLPDDVGEITVSNNLVETCVCDGCCGDDEQHNMQFDAGDESLVLPEGEQGQLLVDGASYDVYNMQSHVIGLCDAPSAFYWVADGS